MLRPISCHYTPLMSHTTPTQSSRVSLPSRRRFLAGAVGATPLILRGGLLSASPNSMLQHACIGVTRMGENDLKNFLQHDKVKIVAICDVDTAHLDKAARLVPDARRYTDWRELLESEGDRIDSVNVTTPDHMHFPIAYRAVMAGKHLYCQKPMCHDLAETRLLAQTVRNRGVISQLGTQHASKQGDRMMTQFLRDGIIGPVKAVHLCSNRAAVNRVVASPLPAPEPPPNNLNWDHWLGTAPERPFLPDTFHPAKWRAWLDFGTSWAADMGIHIFDSTWRGLGLEAPAKVVAEVDEEWKNSPERRAQNWPLSERVTWTFPATGNDLIEGDSLTVQWHDGAFLPPEEARALKPGEYPDQSALVIGAEGALLQEVGSGPILLPREKFKAHPRPDLPPRDHYKHFVDACLGGEPTSSSLPETAPINEAILLATIAIRHPDQELEWDAAAMKIPNHSEAEKLLRRSYREGWRTAGF